MTLPDCPQKAPYPIDLAPGDYWWCACGRSKNQPFCDSSHKGTAFQPKKFTVEIPETKWMCGCKRSANAPYCDGTHKTF
jgi:CDGSH iron-sulfur domain-containing protein 3